MEFNHQGRIRFIEIHTGLEDSSGKRPFRSPSSRLPIEMISYLSTISCLAREGRVVGARQFYLLSVDEISEVEKDPHLMNLSKLGSIYLGPFSRLFLFVTYDHRSR